MVIIIGASSFIGVHTMMNFKQHGVEVFGTGRKPSLSEFYGGGYAVLDFTKPDDFKVLPSKNVDAVIITASLLAANNTEGTAALNYAAAFIETNVLGTLNVLEWCRKNGVNRVISCTTIYDTHNLWDKNHAITEDEPLDFLHKGDHAAYVISKNTISELLEFYNQEYGMSNAVFRLAHVYGAGPHGGLFVNGKYVKSGLQIFMDKASVGEDITVFGDAEVSRDVVSVKDVADAFRLAVASPKTYGLYNISSGHATSLREQAEAIAEVFAPVGKKSRVIVDPNRENHTESYLYSIEKAKRDFNYNPKFSNFYDLVKDWKNDIDNNLYREVFHY